MTANMAFQRKHPALDPDVRARGPLRCLQPKPAPKTRVQALRASRVSAAEAFVRLLTLQNAFDRQRCARSCGGDVSGLFFERADKGMIETIV